MYGFVAYRVANPADAEDLTQLTFERALRKWDRYDERRAAPLTWLLAIARNALIDHQRREKSRRSVRRDLEHELDARRLASSPAADVFDGISPLLHRALSELGEREREVVALRFGGDMVGPEIATLLGLSLTNVQQILSRALRKLRVAVGEAEAGGERAAETGSGRTR